ncbi:CotH kinase family protein [Fibrobacter sp.]|uniref:CotH kinase family protein n=1 Tax=Fibrobacter sp. TaxID=35828 RepID=UPI0026266747|nr:CotH kinase family protein [Fibrobacter sp.]MDD7497536.1 CotH kinase family protein [Fibrobacter sp.]MDY5724257.1 CotH kinase family protein [Fibrobacter sp.]
MFSRIVATFIGFLLCSCVWNDPESTPSYLPIDDSEYPYADLPRIVIETEDFTQIRDRETKIPAKLQIYGKDAPESDVLDLTIKGRGNSSFTGMPKPGYKIKFEKKQELLGMPKDKEWALISNSADKTLLKNFITYKLAGWLGDEYTPRSKFVELYLNRQYQGVYQLVETVKVGEHRVNIPQSDSSFLLERGPTEHGDEHFVVTEKGTKFEIKSPKEPTDSSTALIKKALSQFESFLRSDNPKGEITDYLDFEDYLRYFWIQELSKNLDGAFRRSIFLTWQKGDVIRLGPVWDFDVAYGNWEADTLRTPTDWYIRNSGWNGLIFKREKYWQEAVRYWKDHRDFLATFPDSISKYAAELAPATRNEFKRWPVLENTENWTYKEAYDSYDEAVDSLNSWIKQRIEWIDNHL